MNSRKNIYLLLIILLLAAGCKVSKDLAKPDDAIPREFRGESSSDTTGIALIPIKNFIADPEVHKLIDTALQRNYDLQLAVKNIEAAELLFRQSRLGNLPVLNLQIDFSSTMPSDNSLNGLTAGQLLKTSHIEDYNASAALSWEADLWGKIRNQKRAALSSYLQTKEFKNAVQTRLIANLVQGYYQLLMMDAQLEIAQQNLRLNDSTLKIIQLQFDAGQVTSLALQQAEALKMAAAQIIPRLEQNILVQENALKLLIGEMPGPVWRSRKLTDIRVKEDLSAGLPSAMVSRRPDVRSAELSLQIANARVGIAGASLYPTLSITASGGLNAFKASNWLSVPASLFGVVGAGITQPVFQRRRLRTEYELAKIEREKVVIEFRQSVLLAVGEVSDELAKTEKLEQQYDISLGRQEVLRKAVKNANMLFQNGMANYLEVITAQSSLLQSELETVAIKTARLHSSIELYRALGGGW